MTWQRKVLAAGLLLALAAPVLAQRGGRGGGFGGNRGRQQQAAMTVPYDGRFTFTRVRYNSGMFRLHRQRLEPRLSASRPQPAAHLEGSDGDSRPNTEATQILDLEDPEIFMNPILYMWEPGYWQIRRRGSEEPARLPGQGRPHHLRRLRRPAVGQLRPPVQEAMPDAEWVKLDISHPVYHSFFDMTGVYIPHPTVGVTAGLLRRARRQRPEQAPDCDRQSQQRRGGVLGAVRHGPAAVDTTNDAYKLGANYMIYALTH